MQFQRGTVAFVVNTNYKFSFINYKAKPPAERVWIAKAMLQYLQKESPSVYYDWECFKIRNIAEGDRDEKEFITHGMGVQVSCGMGAEEAA